MPQLHDVVRLSVSNVLPAVGIPGVVALVFVYGRLVCIYSNGFTYRQFKPLCF
jgi:hypothetical protein